MLSIQYQAKIVLTESIARYKLYILNLVNSHNLMTLFIDKASCPELDNSLAGLCRILRVENLVKFLQSPILRLHVEEVDDPIFNQRMIKSVYADSATYTNSKTSQKAKKA